MVDALVDKTHLLVFGLVEADDLADLQVFKYINIAGSGVAVAVDSVALINGSHEGHELAGDDPVEVTVLDLFVVLVLLHVERLEVVPAVFDGFLQTLQAVQDSALVVTLALASISVRLKKLVVVFELSKCLLSVNFQDNNHECAHQEAGICHLGSVSAHRVVINASFALELLPVEKLSQLSAVAMHHRQVEWPEILVKWHVCQVLHPATPIVNSVYSTKVKYFLPLTLSMLKKKAFSMF